MSVKLLITTIYVTTITIIFCSVKTLFGGSAFNIRAGCSTSSFFQYAITWIDRSSFTIPPRIQLIKSKCLQKKQRLTYPYLITF